MSVLKFRMTNKVMQIIHDRGRILSTDADISHVRNINGTILGYCKNIGKVKFISGQVWEITDGI